MIKRTLYFGNPAYLSLRNNQLAVKLPEVETNETLPESFKKEAVRTIPIEDIGVIVLDDKRITLTHGLMEKLLKNNSALITCDSSHMPVGLMLPLAGNSIQSERFREQITASLPLKKQLWQQTIQAKIENQTFVLNRKTGATVKNMRKWIPEVKSDDADNHEGRAAVYYWANLFPHIEGFSRYREGIPPNNLLNYGYAILRAVIARALVSSGLLPTLGIHHRNKYNAYCLADDIMEPYRPFVDSLVFDMTKKSVIPEKLTTELKAGLLSIPVLDVFIEGQRRPLMIAASHTTASLQKCFLGEIRKIKYPAFE